MTDGDRPRFAWLSEELCHRSPWRLILFGIERIAQNKLNVRLTAGEAQHLRLFRTDQQVHDLDLLRLSFGVLLNIGTGRQNLDILQKRLHSCSFAGIGSSRSVTGDQHIHSHSRSYESGHTHNVIDLDGRGSHALRDRRGETAAGTNRGKPAVEHGLPQVKVLHYSSANRILFL